MSKAVDEISGRLARMSREQLEELSCKVRAMLLPNTSGVFPRIYSHEAAKRAIAVAAAGEHSLFLYGPAGVGKTLLSRWAFALGVWEVVERRSCSCGKCDDLFLPGECSPAKIRKHRAKWSDVRCDVSFGVSPVPTREIPVNDGDVRYGTGFDVLRECVERAKLFLPQVVSFDADSENCLRQWRSELGRSVEDVERAKKVAKTIAAIDGSIVVHLVHAMEAVNYSCPAV